MAKTNMFNNVSIPQIIKHFEVKDEEIAKLIEVWKHFNKGDEPELTDNKLTIIPNKKIGEIPIYTFIHLCKFLVTDKLVYIDKFSFKTEVLLVESMTDWIYNHYLNHILDKK